VTGEPYAGIFPIAPTPFTARFDLDLDGQRRVLDCMIDQGVDGICVLANYSEQFLLTDAERDTLLQVCLEHVAGRVPVIVTCSHFSTRSRSSARDVPQRRGADADADAAITARRCARTRTASSSTSRASRKRCRSRSWCRMRR
jgi:dihydrodipicolinate synthase/N-acetylneuraminate lyase